MWPDPWAVVAESDRAQWDYAPLERVGPLRFGMSQQAAAVAMEAGGYASDSATEITKFARLQQLRTRFRPRAPNVPLLGRNAVVQSVGPVVGPPEDQPSQQYVPGALRTWVHPALRSGARRMS
ncbi:hypothetical protein [Streptomyces canus]|uniref:hypothetical protein n=1 Tax=Streptomyces canus TaxID=58343 RepID=UPI0027D8C65E|nr:hypothetical protein [Streptomyces canus]